MLARTKRQAFTLIELLTVMAIIVILIGILTPSLTGARNRSIQTAIKAQINAMSVGLESFHGDEGKYPASNPYLWATDVNNDLGIRDAQMVAWEVAGAGANPLLQGAHILVDAMVGRDFLGYDPRAQPVGPGGSGGGTAYDRWDPANGRRAPYISVDGVDVTSDTEPPEDQTGQYTDLNAVQPTIDGLKCQVFRDKFGWPILYYRAAPAANQNTPIVQTQAGNVYGDGVYDGVDNEAFTSYATSQHRIKDANMPVPVTDYPGAASLARGTFPGATTGHFAEFIRSIRATTYELNNPNIVRPRPVKNDRFIILSPGKDGLYGTIDDIANFEVFSTER